MYTELWANHRISRISLYRVSHPQCCLTQPFVYLLAPELPSTWYLWSSAHSYRLRDRSTWSEGWELWSSVCLVTAQGCISVHKSPIKLFHLQPGLVCLILWSLSSFSIWGLLLHISLSSKTYLLIPLNYSTTFTNCSNIILIYNLYSPDSKRDMK